MFSEVESSTASSSVAIIVSNDSLAADSSLESACSDTLADSELDEPDEPQPINKTGQRHNIALNSVVFKIIIFVSNKSDDSEIFIYNRRKK